jgi:high-affinity iron transporter
MFAVAVIVFRETLEAALFVGILAASTHGLSGRSRYLGAGVLAGAVGAMALAAVADRISALADGVGQDLLNAAILGVALSMLTWHCVWVSSQGQKTAAEARALATSFGRGERKPWALLAVVALSVLREGAETVLFVAGYARGADRADLFGGALAGMTGGMLVGCLIYLGLSRVPLKRMFAMTNTLVLLLAASLASQLARTLSQAGLIDAWGQSLWDTSDWLQVDSAFGTLAHALAGYEPQPTGLQLAFYLVALLGIHSGTRWVQKTQSDQRALLPKVGPVNGTLQKR